MMITPVTSFKATETTPCANCQKPGDVANITAVNNPNKDNTKKANQPSFQKLTPMQAFALAVLILMVGAYYCS